MRRYYDEERDTEAIKVLDFHQYLSVNKQLNKITRKFGMTIPVSHNSKQDFLLFLKKMSKKGFYDILKYIEEEKRVHYNDVLRYALDKKIVDSRASITIILNGLTSLGLLERTVIVDTRPKRTNYSVSKKGHGVIKNIKDLETGFYSLFVH